MGICQLTDPSKCKAPVGIAVEGDEGLSTEYCRLSIPKGQGRFWELLVVLKEISLKSLMKPGI